MFRVWGKLYQNNKMLKDITVSCPEEDTRTHKVFHALDKICYAFDLSRPIWFDTNIKEFKHYAKTRFRQDNFIDEIPFDFFEFHVIEED